MKVLALVVLVVGYSSGLGSGPYLPRGWKPSGPAFYLPTEIEKSSAAVPLKDVPVQENETSGSSFLREYGPPKVEEQIQDTKVEGEEELSGSDALREYGPPKTEEISQLSQDLTVQALPEPITEQAFIVLEAKLSEEEKSAEVALNGAQNPEAEQKALVADVESNNERTLTDDKTDEVETQTESSLAANEVSTEKLEEVVKEKSVEVEQKSVEVNQEETEDAIVRAAFGQKSEEVVEIKVMEEGVKNIAEALVNLEKEIKAQQAETEVSVLRSAQESSGSTLAAPEGFLEYGPPEFTEYGPPKSNLVSATEETSPDASIETNETRRRRFSPKFKKPYRKA